jgi:hypothetical protein
MQTFLRMPFTGLEAIAHRERRYTIGVYPDWSVLAAVKEAREPRQRIDRGEDPLEARRKVESAAETTVKAIFESYLKIACHAHRDRRCGVARASHREG